MVAKAAAVGAVWLLFPFWISALLALWWYVVPPFRIAVFGGHLFALLALMRVFGFGTHAVTEALAIGAIFFLLIGIKDLVFVSRDALHMLLTLATLFFIHAGFSGISDGLGAWSGGGGAFLLALLLSFLVCIGFFRYRFSAFPMAHLAALSGIIALLVAELGVALLFLPVVGWARTALLFAALFLGLEWGKDYLHQRISPLRVMRYSFSFLALLVLVMGITEWTP